jgi:SAM-dependent methyltransferase
MTASGASAPLAGAELEPRACPICGSTAGRELAPARFDLARLDAFAFASRKRPEHMHFRLVLCETCDLAYASPAPAARALEAAYEGAAFDAAEESRYAAATYASFLPGIVGELPGGNAGRALDIGTGDGAFLRELLAAGFEDVTGVEPSAAPIAAADPAVRGRIRHGPFRAGDFAAEQLSLVTCFQTLEHVPDPLQLCRDAWHITRRGGALLVVCHDRRALANRLMGRRSPIYDIEHLQLFSPASLRALLSRAGFGRVDLRSVVNRYPIAYWARLLPIPAAAKDALLRGLRATSLGRAPLALPVGNLAAIAWRA